MPLMNRHMLGWPCWIQLNSPDVAESRRFYQGLFGWDTYTLTFGGLAEVEICTLGGVQGPEVASLQSLADDTQPSSWMCCFRSDDIEASVARVKVAGGAELADPIDYGDLGRFALCADSEGADFALWKAYNLAGVGVVDEPSAPCWVELASRDVEGARRFYGEVFGWLPADRDYYGTSYTEFKVGGLSVAGMVLMDEQWPPDVAPHWIPYIEVADCDASTERAVALGATVRIGPTTIATGRFSIMTDPTGTRLAIITPDPETRAGFRMRP
jgi:predicted enzyme related to lactoylglutathione lyase